MLQVPQIENLRRIEVVDHILSLPLIRSLISTLVPTLALRIVLLLVPTALLLLCRSQGMYAESQVEFGVTRKYFLFQVCSLAITVEDTRLDHSL